MPQARHNGPYIPRSNVYGGDGKLYIRVDLPGFDQSHGHRLKKKDFPTLEKSEAAHWFGVESKDGEESRVIEVKGHRSKPAKLTRDSGQDRTHPGNSFGLFNLSFPIVDGRFNSVPVIDFEHATLRIILSQEDLNNEF
jgi:hypothetical protein